MTVQLLETQPSVWDVFAPKCSCELACGVDLAHGRSRGAAICNPLAHGEEPWRRLVGVFAVAVNAVGRV